MCDSQAEQTGDERDRPERLRGRSVYPEQAVAALPGDGLVELEGRRWCGCHRVKDRGLVKGFPGGRATRW